MPKGSYSLSFTTGGLFLRESLIFAKLFQAHPDWKVVRYIAKEENSLQTRTQTSLVRVAREVSSRLAMLNGQEIDFLLQGSHKEQVQLLWIAVCRKYPIIAEFATEVLRERFIILKPDLPYEEFDTFLNRKSDWHPEVDQLSETTRKKLRQVLFKMLREAELISEDNLIHAAYLNQSMLDLITRGDAKEALYFPVFETDLQGAKK